MHYFLSLGSNLGNRRKNLARALRALEEAGVNVVRVSSVYKTEPVDGAGPNWFFNIAAEIQTCLAPEALLRLIQAVEQKLGRPANKRGEPRVIDIDILLAGDRIIHSEQLSIPHPRLDKRNFVLVPLAEISGETVHPGRQKKINELRGMSTDRAAVKKLARPLAWRDVPASER